MSGAYCRHAKAAPPEAELWLGGDLRIGHEFQVGIEAEGRHRAGHRPGQPFGGGRIADADVTGGEQPADGIQVDAPVAGDDGEHMARGAPVEFGPQNKALGGLGDGMRNRPGTAGRP